MRKLYLVLSISAAMILSTMPGMAAQRAMRELSANPDILLSNPSLPSEIRVPLERYKERRLQESSKKYTKLLKKDKPTKSDLLVEVKQEEQELAEEEAKEGTQLPTQTPVEKLLTAFDKFKLPLSEKEVALIKASLQANMEKDLREHKEREEKKLSDRIKEINNLNKEYSSVLEKEMKELHALETQHFLSEQLKREDQDKLDLYRAKEMRVLEKKLKAGTLSKKEMRRLADLRLSTLKHIESAAASVTGIEEGMFKLGYEIVKRELKRLHEMEIRQETFEPNDEIAYISALTFLTKKLPDDRGRELGVKQLIKLNALTRALEEWGEKEIQQEKDKGKKIKKQELNILYSLYEAERQFLDTLFTKGEATAGGKERLAEVKKILADHEESLRQEKGKQKAERKKESSSDDESETEELEEVDEGQQPDVGEEGGQGED